MLSCGRAVKDRRVSASNGMQRIGMAWQSGIVGDRQCAALTGMDRTGSHVMLGRVDVSRG